MKDTIGIHVPRDLDEQLRNALPFLTGQRQTAARVRFVIGEWLQGRGRTSAGMEAAPVFSAASPAPGPAR